MNAQGIAASVRRKEDFRLVTGARNVTPDTVWSIELPRIAAVHDPLRCAGNARVVPYGLLAPAKETQGVEVVGIASRTPQKAEEFAARHGIPRGFGSYEALLESGDIDAVYIALPPALHFDWVRRAIEAGKHVLCEKPLAENAQLAQELMLCARQHGRVLVEAMHIRYLDRLRRQRELVAGGEFGRLLRIESCFERRIRVWRRMISACASNWRRRCARRGLLCGQLFAVRGRRGARNPVGAVQVQQSSNRSLDARHAAIPIWVEGAVEFGFRVFTCLVAALRLPARMDR